MGVTLRSKNMSLDMGYGGFNRFRKKVAELSNKEFGEHFNEVEKGLPLYGKEQEAFYQAHDVKTNALIEKGMITVEIANFCYQSDSEGSIDQYQAKQIYEKIKAYDDTIAYGYAAHADCTLFKDLKDLFRNCTENGKSITWY